MSDLKMSREKVMKILADAHAKKERANLRGLDLSRLDLSGLDFHCAEMTNANLSHTNLSGTNLNHAVLSCADLSGANLSNAYMHYTIAFETNLTNANLLGAYMYGADMCGADLTGAKTDGLFIGELDANKLFFVPNEFEWHLTFGFWKGTLDEFREMIAEDEEWVGDNEVLAEQQRVNIEIADMCDAHIAAHPNALRDVMVPYNRWGW